MSEGKVKPLRLHWDSKQCTGCISCVVVCSERHTGMSTLSRSRIQITVDPLDGSHSGKWCRQCNNAPCAQACPQEAIRFDESVRAWLVDDNLCTGCGLCVDACPFEIMRLDPVTGLAIKCDLCLGAFHCVQVCPAEALSVKGRGEEK